MAEDMEATVKGALNLLEGLADSGEATVDDETAALMTILGMDEAQFDFIAPSLLDAYQRRLNTPQNKLALTQSLNAVGLTVDDLQTAMNELQKVFNESELSAQKRNFLVSLCEAIVNAAYETEGIAKRFVNVNIKKLDERVKLPAYGSLGAAGMDVYALDEVTIGPGETVKIPCGFALEIPTGYAVLVQPRSGLSAKSKLRICNTPGLIDSDYRGEICVLVENIEPRVKDIIVNENDNSIVGIAWGNLYTIGAGERFAQLRLVEAPRAILVEQEAISETDRGEGGFGSTGK